MPGHAFQALPDLKKLYLNNNDQIDSINANLLQGNPNLEIFQMQVHTYTRISVGFRHCLCVLLHCRVRVGFHCTASASSLQACALTSIPANVFRENSALKNVDIRDNQLSTLPEGLLDGIGVSTQNQLLFQVCTSLPRTSCSSRSVPLSPEPATLPGLYLTPQNQMLFQVCTSLPSTSCSSRSVPHSPVPAALPGLPSPQNQLLFQVCTSLPRTSCSSRSVPLSPEPATLPGLYLTPQNQMLFQVCTSLPSTSCSSRSVPHSPVPAALPGLPSPQNQLLFQVCTLSPQNQLLFQVCISFPHT